MTMTNHGNTRMKERAGVGKSTRKFERMALNAKSKGYPRMSTRGALRDYIEDRREFYGYSKEMRVYAGMLFVFEKDLLITVYPLPGRIQNKITQYVCA